MQRRTTLKLGLGASLLSSLPLSGLAGQKTSGAEQLQVLVNRQYTEAGHLADAMLSRNIAVQDISGDLGSLWYRSIKPQMESKPAVLFGMTDTIDLFCLEELARDFGMQTRFRLDHIIHSNGRVEHVPADGLNLADIRQLLPASPGFGAKADELSALALQYHHQPVLHYKKSGPFQRPDNTPLVTWLIS